MPPCQLCLYNVQSTAISSVVSLVSWIHHYRVLLTIISCQALSYIISNIVTYFKMHFQAGFKLGVKVSFAMLHPCISCLYLSADVPAHMRVFANLVLAVRDLLHIGCAASASRVSPDRESFI